MIPFFRWSAMYWMGFLLLAGALVGAPVHAQAPEGTTSANDSALSILKRTLNLLANQKQFSFTAELGFDVVQGDGQKIEFGSRRRLIIQRPHRIRLESQKRNGQQLQVIYNGSEISFFSARENKYAIKPKTGTLDDFLNVLVEELEVEIPLAQVGYKDFPEIIMEKIDAGFIIGESTVAGIVCDHLAFRNDQTDFQIWIRKSGKPLPVRWVITYKHNEGQPQFWVQFIEWNLNPKIEDSTFSFIPPKGAERIQFMSQTSAYQQGVETPIKEDKQ